MTTKIYTVKTGDSLTKIATNLFGNVNRWKEIAHINNLAHPYIVYPGQLLEIPNGEGLIVEVQADPDLMYDTKQAPPATPVRGKDSSSTTAQYALLAGVAILLVIWKQNTR